MKKVVLYQVKEEFVRDFGFMSYEMLKKYGGFDFDHYKKIYESEREDDYTEDSAFHEFNVNHPKDFKGHSMSTGDIVVIDNKALYCDSFGWKLVMEI